MDPPRALRWYGRPRYPPPCLCYCFVSKGRATSHATLEMSPFWQPGNAAVQTSISSQNTRAFPNMDSSLP